MGLRNPIALHRPVGQELNAELNRQRLISRELLALRDHAEAGDARAKKLLQSAEKMDRQSDEMLEQIRSYNAQLDAMRSELDTLKKQPRSTVDPAPPTPAIPQGKVSPTEEAPPLIAPDVKRGELPKEGKSGGLMPR